MRFVAVRGLPFIAAILVLKWALLLVLFPKHPDIVVSPDTRTYVRPALSLLRAGVYAKSPVDLSRPEVNRTPGYPILIAAVYAVVGERVLALAFVNTLLCAGTAVVLSATAARLFGPGAALWAAILFAIEPSNFHYSMMALSDAPFVFVLSLAIWAFVRAADRPGSVARWGAIGGLLAAAILIRPVSSRAGPPGREPAAGLEAPPLPSPSSCRPFSSWAGGSSVTSEGPAARRSARSRTPISTSSGPRGSWPRWSEPRCWPCRNGSAGRSSSTASVMRRTRRRSSGRGDTPTSTRRHRG